MQKKDKYWKFNKLQKQDREGFKKVRDYNEKDTTNIHWEHPM